VVTIAFETEHFARKLKVFSNIDVVFFVAVAAITRCRLTFGLFPDKKSHVRKFVTDFSIIAAKSSSAATLLDAHYVQLNCIPGGNTWLVVEQTNFEGTSTPSVISLWGKIALETFGVVPFECQNNINVVKSLQKRIIVDPKYPVILVAPVERRIDGVRLHMLQQFLPDVRSITEFAFPLACREGPWRSKYTCSA
jgi:hypothetical protein